MCFPLFANNLKNTVYEFMSFSNYETLSCINYVQLNIYVSEELILLHFLPLHILCLRILFPLEYLF